MPTIVIVRRPEEDYLGRYWSPAREETLLDSRVYDRTNGIIEIAEDATPSTIAHEFRHHWQHMAGVKFDHRLSILDGMSAMEEGHFRKSMVEFFLTSNTERDALLYSVSKYPDDWDSERLEWMRDPAIRERVRRFPAELWLLDKLWVYTGAIYRLYEAPKPKSALSVT